MSALEPLADHKVASRRSAERTLLATRHFVGYAAHMECSKRSFIATVVGGSMAACVPLELGRTEEGKSMYGLIGKMIAVDGQRDALAEILLEGLRDMPGNLSYIVAAAADSENALWITEVWTDSEAHSASLALPSVQEAIGKGRPLIAGMERIAETHPIGGHGIS